jgi:two-component system, cell cycle response regulator DivK
MKKILQIEDHPASRLLIERILQPHGYEILHADTGEGGITLALAEKPDLILIDMGLPDIDGQTVVTHLRQNPNFSRVPIVAITAWPPETAAEMAQRYGCDGCIVKPIDIARFPAEIAAYLPR